MTFLSDDLLYIFPQVNHTEILKTKIYCDEIMNQKGDHMKASRMGLSEVVKTIVSNQQIGDPIAEEDAPRGRTFTFENHISLIFKAILQQSRSKISLFR